jgi:hypothetical protein
MRRVCDIESKPVIWFIEKNRLRWVVKQTDAITGFCFIFPGGTMLSRARQGSPSRITPNSSYNNSALGSYCRTPLMVR